MSITQRPCYTPEFIIANYSITNIAGFDAMNTTKRAATLFGNGDINSFPIIPTTAANASSTLWVFIPKSNMTEHHLPLPKPLMVECPISACVLPISGIYGLLSRYLYYLNVVIATVATFLPVLRGIAQISLSASLASSAVYYLVLHHADKVASRQIFNLDYAPLIITIHGGLYSILFWFFTRSGRSRIEESGGDQEAGTAREHGRRRRTGTRPRPKNLSRWPIVLVASPVYIAATLTVYFMALHNRGQPFPRSLAVIVFDPITGNYRLTSTCYSDAYGAAHPWDSAAKVPLRRIGDAVLYTPRSPDILASESLQLIPRSAGHLSLFLSVVICVIIFAMGICESPWGGWVETKMSSVREVVTKWLCCAGLLQYLGRAIPKALSDRPQALLLIPMGTFAAAIIVSVWRFEMTMGQKDPPVAEPPGDFGQWGPWVGAFVVLVIAVLARWLWGFDSSRGASFGWIVAPKKAAPHLEAAHPLTLPHNDTTVTTPSPIPSSEVP
ncbi:MAG: hypothetical protein M1840_001745 [Geoglossum simile]|nr:MAG: hypothetical protein M1840_001745 [Geoglossum simile]